MVIVFNTCW